MNIQVYRGEDATVRLPLDESTFNDVLMGEHTLVFSFTKPYLLDIRVGDTLTYKSQLMTVNAPPFYTNDGDHVYGVTFQGVRHDLERWLIKDEGTPFFDYFGDLSDYMAMFLESVKSDGSGWTLGDIDDVEPLPLSFDMVDSFSALTMIAELFECEWIIRGKQISIKKSVGIARDLSFSYGRGNGLYSLTRENIENLKIVNRVYAAGGIQNLPKDYGKRLTLPDYLEDAASVALYGVRQDGYKNEDIYPKRTGTVSGIGQINEGTWIVNDASIDFDIDGQRIAGTDAQIVFTSGALNGQSFKILSYKHATKEIRYEANKDNNGQLSPVGLSRAEVGDKYTLVGIRMPQSYVDAAMAELTARAQEFLDSNKVPRIIYSLDVDVLHLKKLNTEIHAGDIVNIKDSGIGVDANIRVTAVSYPGHFPDVLENGMRFTADISSEVTYTTRQKMEKDIKENRDVITQVTRTSTENDRRNIAAINEFKDLVFDPDGNLQNPLIEAIVGFFGAQSMLYDLEDVSYQVNVGGNPNAFAITGGKLVHKVYKIDALGYTWDLAPLVVSGLDPLKAYYLSAKCSRTALLGEWVLSDTQIATDAELGYWHFNLGILSSVIDGGRSLRSTKGYTIISGGEIVTDSITAYQINVAKLFAQVIEVGSNGYTNAGISGETKEEPNQAQSVRFWAGSNAAGRDGAPFRVLDDGSMVASMGNIGLWNIGSGIYAGQPWQPNSTYTSFSPGDYLMRRNGNNPLAAANDFIEIAMGYLGTGAEIGARIRNDLQSFGSNTALALGAKNGAKNIALDVYYGMSRLKSVCTGVQIVINSGTLITAESKLVVVNGVAGAVGDPNLFLPAAPDMGREITIKNNSGSTFALQANSSVFRILSVAGATTGAVFISNNNVRSYQFDGQNWIELTTH